MAVYNNINPTHHKGYIYWKNPPLVVPLCQKKYANFFRENPKKLLCVAL